MDKETINSIMRNLNIILTFSQDLSERDKKAIIEKIESIDNIVEEILNETLKKIGEEQK